MSLFRKETLQLLSYSVPAMLIGLLVLATAYTIFGHAMSEISKLHPALSFLLIGGANGLVVAGIIEAIHALTSLYQRSRGKRIMLNFCCGASCVFLAVSGFGVFVLTCATLLFMSIHLRRFSHVIRALLRPGTLPQASQVRTLLEIAVNIIAAFTLLNASLEMLHRFKILGPQFSFSDGAPMILDAFYFTVITLTTVGFGDITPLSQAARLLVSIESLIGYGMLALVIGVVTRGIVPDKHTN